MEPSPSMNENNMTDDVIENENMPSPPPMMNESSSNMDSPQDMLEEEFYNDSL